MTSKVVVRLLFTFDLPFLLSSLNVNNSLILGEFRQILFEIWWTIAA
jgi:hypothetical protein